MNLKQLIVATVLAFTAGNSFAQQPLNLCCHPNDIKDWTPGKNADDVFNVSKVPLAKRFKEPTLMKANSQQFYEGQLCNSTILYPTCSMCPSQGEINNFLGYQPTYWQYMDKLVYWAGAASEGIINIPPAASTDAAHAQGVKSLGNIFFPPYAFGGTQAWVRQMLTVENGKYIYAQKLYELCKYFNFDGWFINEESGGGSESEWEGFFKDFYAAATADGNTTAELQWYNASWTPNTTLLKTHKNTSQFLEYGAVNDYRSYASSLNCTTDEVFSKIYAGVQCASSGATGWMGNMDRAWGKTGHVTSLDLFCPEVSIWETPAKAAFKSNTSNHGEKAYAIAKTVFDNEEDMWVNYDSDPSVIKQTNSSYTWQGVSSRILERSAITAMPFVSNMSVGNGKHRFVEGEIKGTADWYHSGMQSILPTWRWWIENRDGLNVSIDWDNAYNVGSSFKIAGNLTAGSHLIRLYKTQIPVTAGGVYRVVYKTESNITLVAKISTNSSTTPDVTIQPNVTEKNGWKIAEYNLSELNGKTIYMLALDLVASNAVSDLSMNLGQVAVLPASYSPTAVEVKDFVSSSKLGDLKGDIRITWNYTWNEHFDHFDVYTETVDGTRKLVGQTRGLGFYVPAFERKGTDAHINVELVPIMKDGSKGEVKKLQLDYPAPKAPIVTLSVSPKSYCVVGETVTVTANAKGNPTSYKWTLPEGVELAEGSSLTNHEIKVVARTAGKKLLKVDVANTVGTSNFESEAFDVFADATESNEVHNVVKGKTVVSFSGSTNSTEVPANIIDGITNPNSTSAKWCNVSADNEVIFDCGSAYRVYGFRIYDGNAGPESGVDQIDRYTIELSQDMKTWVTVVDREGTDAESIKTDYIAPHKGRYVRLRPHVNGILRIWEFEVYGKDDNNMTIEVAPAALRLTSGETKNIVVTYALNGDERAESFTCTATAGSKTTIGTITENQAACTFTVPVTGNKVIGTENVKITVNNGGAYKERNVAVTIDTKTQPNVLAGATAKLRKYNSDYSYEATYDEYAVKTLTDGDTKKNGCENIEKASVNKRDVWAIFEAPTAEGWNLSKVKIHIPENNKGKNENDTEGHVNNTIEICVGNDLHSMTTIKSFTNLGDVSELEYILPEYKKTKYLAIVCDLNAYYYASLSEVEAYEQYADAIPVVGALEVTGWNMDVIAEKNIDDVTGYLDDASCALYAAGCKEEGAIAGNDRKVKTRSGFEFILPPYDSDNALVMKNGGENTLTVTNPEMCEELHFLFISANGASTASVVVNYEDGTESDAASFIAYDWYSNSAAGDEAVYGLGRIQSSSFDTRLKFRLYEFTMPTDATKKITSLTVSRTSYSGYPTLLAIGKKGYKPNVNAIDNFGQEEIKIVGIYSLNGMKLNNIQKGINIVKYSNGTTRKMIVR